MEGYGLAGAAEGFDPFETLCYRFHIQIGSLPLGLLVIVQ